MELDENIVIPDPAVTGPATTPRTKKTRAANKPKERTLEVLDTISPKSMTQEERVSYIVACRQALHQLNSKCAALDTNSQKAFEQFRNADESYNKLKADADARLAFAKQAVEVCAKTVAMIGGTR